MPFEQNKKVAVPTADIIWAQTYAVRGEVFHRALRSWLVNPDGIVYVSEFRDYTSRGGTLYRAVANDDTAPIRVNADGSAMYRKVGAMSGAALPSGEIAPVGQVTEPVTDHYTTADLVRIYDHDGYAVWSSLTVEEADRLRDALGICGNCYGCGHRLDTTSTCGDSTCPEDATKTGAMKVCSWHACYSCGGTGRKA